MTDVGRLAGVSAQTVSRVINNRPGVHPATRERVLQAVQQLGFRPNSAARALVTGRSGVLGVACYDPTLYGPASTLLGIQRAARAAGHLVTIANLPLPGRPSLLDACARLRLQGVDGIVVVAPHVDVAETLSNMPRVPTVVVSAQPVGDLPRAMIDHEYGAELATRHLLGLGHLTVSHIAGPPTWRESHQRVAGWRRALDDAHVPAPPVLHGDWSPHSGYRVGRQLVADPSITAIFAANDQMAFGAVRAYTEAGLRIGHDISVVGFDDMPEAAHFWPPLTTVRQDFVELGRRCVQLLLGEMHSDPPGADVVVIAPELIVRSSTGSGA